MAKSQLLDYGLWDWSSRCWGSHSAADRASRVSDRTAFTAIVFVLVTGVPWRMIPRQIGCSGVTAWRRLRAWQRAGG